MKTQSEAIMNTFILNYLGYEFLILDLKNNKPQKYK